MLGSTGVFTAIIPESAGAPMDEVFRLGMHAELLFPNVHIAHATLIEKGGVAICGMGGSIAETRLLGIDSYSRTTTRFLIRSLLKAKQSRKILLLSAPPSGPLGGAEGNSVVEDLIDTHHPDVCVVAGKSELRGVQRSANTLVINAGCGSVLI
jgi:Icc-related predicted phosphoesterase